MAEESEKRLVKLKSEVRSEPSTQISELNLTPCSSASTAVLDELIGAAKSIARIGDLKKLASEARKNSTLEPPLHRQLASRLRRKAAYEEIVKELKRWDPIVRRNRASDHLVFPRDEIGIGEETPDKTAKRFTARTPLEIETAKLLQSSKNTLDNDRTLTEAESEAVKKMSAEEAREKLNYMRRMRALISYQEAKFKRQKRIKGKQYHRLLKRNLRQKTLKEFEDLIASNPAAALEKWNQLERDRIMERALLKHRGTGKWAKQMRVYQKRDPKVREALQEHFRLSRELAEKIKKTRELEETESLPFLPVFDTPGEKSVVQAPGSDPPVDLELQPMLAVDLESGGEDDDDQEALIAEAFADDDVVADFQAEVEADSSEKTDQDPDDMPGWNRWTGPDIVAKRRKKDTEKPKKDLSFTAVHINSQGDEAVKKLQVSSLPFPFTAPEAFEAKLSCPLGREWNPETVFNALNKPSVVTKMGTIIKPMSREQVLKNRPNSANLPRRRRKKKKAKESVPTEIKIR